MNLLAGSEFAPVTSAIGRMKQIVLCGSCARDSSLYIQPPFLYADKTWRIQNRRGGIRTISNLGTLPMVPTIACLLDNDLLLFCHSNDPRDILTHECRSESWLNGKIGRSDIVPGIAPV